MSCCAVMLVRDEADIIAATLRHLRTQVDEVILLDNGSTDGTREEIEFVKAERKAKADWITVIDDDEVGYNQSAKTTMTARLAQERGHQWVLPCDADEVWYAPDGRPLNAYLDGLAPDVQIVTAELFNHIPTAEDPPEWEKTLGEDGTEGILRRTPFERIGWRKREHGALPKVCCRTHESLAIEAGNHAAHYAGVSLTVTGLVIRHFSWRSPGQYVKKILNGVEAYRAADVDESLGVHWRMWEGHTEDDIAAHFRQWFWSPYPALDRSLIYDPAPFGR